MANIKFCMFLAIGIFLVFPAPVLGESCEINASTPKFVPYAMGGITLFTMPENLMPEYLSTEINYSIELDVLNKNCSIINNTVNITVSVCRDSSCTNYTFYNRTLLNNNYFLANSHFKLPEKPTFYYPPSIGGFSSQTQENPISFPEEGNYTIKLQFFNNKNEVQHNITVEKKVSSLEKNIGLYSSLSSLIFSGLSIILTIALIILSSFSFIEIFKLMYDNIFKKIEEKDYNTALKNILKPLFYLYLSYLVLSFLINLLVYPAMWLSLVLNNIEIYIILFAFYSLLFTRKLRNRNIISLILALCFLFIFIYDTRTNISNIVNNESLYSGGFLGIIFTFSEILIGIMLVAVYIISFSAIIAKMFFIVKALNPEKVSLIKIDFRNKIKEHKNLISLLPDFISFYLVYVILKNLYLLQEIIIHPNFNPFYNSIWIIFTIFLLIANILIKRIMEIEKLSIESLDDYISSFLLIFFSLVAINGLLSNIDIIMSYKTNIYGAIILITMICIPLITVIRFIYIFRKYSRNISYFIHKHVLGFIFPSNTCCRNKSRMSNLKS